MAQIDYYTIFRWMREELHLENTELECYAVIYNLSRGDNWFNAGVKNIMDVLGKSEPCVINALKSLTQKELIVKVPVIVNNAKRHYYKAANTLDEDTLNNLSNPTLNNLTPINKIKNKENKEKRLSNDNQKKGGSSSRFVKPTIEQIEAYIKEKGYHFDAEHFWNYYESKGWKVGNSPMKNWKAACATWESKRKSENPDKSEETTDLPAGLTPGKWEQARNWFKTRVPRIAGSITPNDHLSMMALARWKRDVYIEILIKIEASDYTGSILEEFERISETEEYSQRLWGNE